MVMLAVHWTTTLSVCMSAVALVLIIAAVLVVLRWEDASLGWGNWKIFSFWSLVVLAIAAIVVAIAVPATAFEEARKGERGLGDGPRFESEQIDGRPVDGITEMADNFPNVATKCVWDGWRAFVTSNGDHLYVVRDEQCEYEETGPS